MKEIDEIEYETYLVIYKLFKVTAMQVHESEMISMVDPDSRWSLIVKSISSLLAEILSCNTQDAIDFFIGAISDQIKHLKDERIKGAH